MEKNKNVTLENHKKEKELGMGWHNFLVFYLGFVGVVAIVLGAVEISLGYITRPSAILGGIIGMGVGALAFAARGALKEFAANGLKLLIWFYILRTIWNVVDTFLPLFMGGAGSYTPDIPHLVGVVIKAIIMIAINSVYYEKRRHMFEDDEEE